MSKFTKQHYNAIAKTIRENLTETTALIDKRNRLTATEAVVNVALSLAHRFKMDNELFDPLIFLDQCSPDVDSYPLSELWEDYASSVS